MIKTKEELNFYLAEDAKRNGMDCPFWKYLVKRICGSESANVMHWIRHYRKWEYHANNSGVFHRLSARYHEILTKRIGLRLGIHAGINKIGYGLRIMHLGGGTYLNVKQIGNYCGFNTGVLLGNSGDIDDLPVIGDYVAFGPGAKAFGNITVGDHAFVAANAVVTKSVAPGCIVGGIPAKVIK